MAGALGVHALTVATCLTVQNRHGLERLHLTPVGLLRDCLRVAVADGPVHAIKLGLAGAPEILRAVLEFTSEHLPTTPVIVDPVLGVTSGGLEVGEDLVAEYLTSLPMITVLTPNLPELERLAPDGVGQLIAGGCPNVFVTGGHGKDATVEDRLVTGSDELTIRHSRLDTGPVHGTGCALASAVAAHLAGGLAVEEACRHAVADLVESLCRTPDSVDGFPVPLVITASR